MRRIASRLTIILTSLLLFGCASPWDQLALSFGNQYQECQSLSGDNQYYCHQDLQQRRGLTTQATMGYIGSLNTFGTALHVDPPSAYGYQPVAPAPRFRTYCYSAGTSTICQ